MKVMAYKEGHLDFLIPKEGYFEDKGLIAEAIKDLTDTVAVTVVKNRIVVAVFGITQKRKGIFECWSMIGNEVKRNPIEFYRTVKSLIKEYEEKLNIVRLEMTVKHNLRDACKFAASLGFDQEGLMRKYGLNGEDYFLYARTK